MTTGKRGWAGLAAVAAVAAVVAMAVAPAGASNVIKVNSTISISSNSYGGEVGSARKACRAGRKVVLKQRGHGVLGRTTSYPSGHWRVDSSAFYNLRGKLPYKIFAEVKPRSDGTPGTIFRCRGATSKTNTYNGINGG
jgi:hypothetical protein